MKKGIPKSQQAVGRDCTIRYAIPLHKTEATRASRARSEWKLDIGESIRQCTQCCLTAHFPALWLEFQPAAKSRGTAGRYTIKCVSPGKDRRVEGKNLFAALESESSLEIFPSKNWWTRSAPDELLRWCYCFAGSGVKVPRYFQSPKERSALPISHIIISHYVRIKT